LGEFAWVEFSPLGLFTEMEFNMSRGWFN
jgi:hypothetical protein